MVYRALAWMGAAARTLAVGAMVVGIVGLAFDPTSNLFFGLMASGAFCIVTWVD